MRRYFAEMPVAMTWLCVTAVLFNSLWLAVAFGLVHALRRTDALRRLLSLGLLSLPLVWIALRALAEGGGPEARTRRLRDRRVLAIGIADLRARRGVRRARRVTASTRGRGGTGPSRSG